MPSSNDEALPPAMRGFVWELVNDKKEETILLYSFFLSTIKIITSRIERVKILITNPPWSPNNAQEFVFPAKKATYCIIVLLVSMPPPSP